MNRSKFISFLQFFVVPVVIGLVTWLFDPLIELKDYYKNDTQIILIIQGALTIIVLAAITYIGIMYLEIQKNTKDISDSLGSSVELLKYGDKNKYSTPFDLPIELIKNAEKEVLVLDYFPWPGLSDSDPKIDDIDLRYKDYYDELINSATKKESIEYHRLIQIPKTDETSLILESLLKNNIVKEHFKKMIEIMSTDKTKSRVSIRTCKTVYPTTTFIIIDKKHVIWEIPYILDQKKFKFDLDLYIIDSQGKLAEELRERFLKLSDTATPLTL